MMSDDFIAVRRDLGHEPALDGIREIALLLVTFWHYPDEILGRRLEWLKAGHLGVDLFFVLSGFLITALLLKEYSRNGQISFRSFYRRRAFRLLPALILFLIAHAVWAMLTNIPSGLFSPGTDLTNEIASIIGALFFSINLIGYFGYQATLGAGHLWSLAVEEQFYFIWPLLTAALLSRNAFFFRCAIGVTAVLFAIAGYFFRRCTWNPSTPDAVCCHGCHNVHTPRCNHRTISFFSGSFRSRHPRNLGNYVPDWLV